MRRPVPTHSISVLVHATIGSIIPPHRAMCRATWSGLKTWMSTASGVTLRAMVTSGCRIKLTWVGHRTATGIGSGLILGDGLGLKTSPGATLRSTMAAGSITTIIGDGRPDRSTFARTILLRWSHGSAARDGVLESDLVVAMATDGARLDSVSRSFRGMARVLVTSIAST